MKGFKPYTVSYVLGLRSSVSHQKEQDINAAIVVCQHHIALTLIALIELNNTCKVGREIRPVSYVKRKQSKA